MNDTPNRRCAICKTPTPGHACARCQDATTALLTEILDFYALTEGELEPGRGAGQRSSEQGIGVRVTALDFLAGGEVLDTLREAEDDIRRHYDLTPIGFKARPTTTLTATIRFLKAWLPRTCTDYPDFRAIYESITTAYATARSAARMTAAPTQTIRCPADEDNRPNGICGSRIRVDADHITGRVHCRRCRTEWNVAHLMNVAIATPGADFWADPEAAARWFKVSVRTLRRWAAAGDIQRDHGRYELHSIYAAIHADAAANAHA